MLIAPCQYVAPITHRLMEVLKKKIGKQLCTGVCVLTVVGELHSLTDWHVSEASEDAELDDF